MAKITFSKLKLNKVTEVSVIKIGDVEIEVKHYIPMSEKIMILDTIIKEAADYNYINKAKADALLHLYMMMSYTNITFTSKERENLLDIYDLLEKNGVIDAVVSTIPENEYGSFITYCDEVMSDYDKYKNSLMGVVTQILDEMPERLEGVNSLMKNFKPEDLKSIQDIISNLGGSAAAVTDTMLGQK